MDVNTRRSSSRIGAGIGGDTARLLLMANLSFRTTEQKLWRVDIDARSPVVIAADAGWSQVAGLDDAALLIDAATCHRAEPDTTLLSVAATDTANGFESLERLAVIPFGAASWAGGLQATLAAGRATDAK